MLIEVTDHFDNFKSLLNVNQITEIKQLGDRTAIFISDGRQIHIKESYEDIVKLIK
ncbi:flagellar FlbD family protein [Ornithinibacillus sp. JPR2-1]|uniref:flagellar FlbD family protein n=1 Tax=Ornithinibacillus sp. JPR2-1 TaxID=2094019 RepID=UPI0031D7663E